MVDPAVLPTVDRWATAAASVLGHRGERLCELHVDLHPVPGQLLEAGRRPMSRRFRMRRTPDLLRVTSWYRLRYTAISSGPKWWF